MGYEIELFEVRSPTTGKTFRVYEDESGEIQVRVGGTYVTQGLPLAAFSMDASGNVTGLVGPDGSLRGAPYRVFADISAPADTAENVLASFVIPGNSVPIGGLIRVTALIEHTNSANAKTYRMYIGGQSVLAAAASNNLNYQIQQNIYRRSATGVLGWPASNAYSSGTTIALNDRTVDMSVDQTFQFTGQKAAGAENITLKALILEVL